VPGTVSHKAFVAQDGERPTRFEVGIGGDLARLGDAFRAPCCQGARTAEAG
jgi:hypothetical protein